MDMKTDDHKNATRIIILLAVFLVVIVASAYMVQKYKVSKVLFTYNGFKIRREMDNGGNLYSIDFYLNDNDSPSKISVRNNPNDLENIPIESNLKPKLLKKEAFITMEPRATGLTVVGAVEISKVLGNQYLYGVPTKGALVRDDGTNQTVKTCADADSDTAIVYLLKANTTSIYSEGECVIVEGSSESDIIRASDRLVLTMLGVMKE